MINAFLDWAQEQQNGKSYLPLASKEKADRPEVWIVSNEQLLDWVQHPVPVSQLDQIGSLKCSTPQVDTAICNGMPQQEKGLLSHCSFSDFPFYTCVRTLTTVFT